MSADKKKNCRECSGMIPTPDRVVEGKDHWWVWFYEPAKPGITRYATLVTVKRDG